MRYDGVLVVVAQNPAVEQDVCCACNERGEESGIPESKVDREDLAGVGARDVVGVRDPGLILRAGAAGEAMSVPTNIRGQGRSERPIPCV